MSSSCDQILRFEWRETRRGAGCSTQAAPCLLRQPRNAGAKASAKDSRYDARPVSRIAAVARFGWFLYAATRQAETESKFHDSRFIEGLYEHGLMYDSALIQNVGAERMSRAYSVDLRERVLNAVAAGGSARGASARADVQKKTGHASEQDRDD